MGRLLAFLLLAMGLMVPAIAQDDTERPEWVGVWQGSIGRLPIVVCLDRWNNGNGRGSYYYMSQLKPIRLEGDKSGHEWTEGRGTGEPGSDELPALQFTDIAVDRIVGRWRAGKRSYGILLHRIPDTAEDYFDACGSASFLKPRVVEPAFVRETASTGDFGYTRLIHQTPAHFADVDIAGFTFEPKQPGDAKIIEWLDSRLPKGEVEDDFLQCLAGVLTMYGEDGYYSMGLSPDFANDELLSITSDNSSYCGGAHPNHWSEYFSFDRRTGALLDPFDWFSDEGVGETEFGSKVMMPPLREAVLKHWPDYSHYDEADDCSGFATNQLWWNYQIRREGIQFQPDFPHVITACEERLLVPWSELEPFLSDVGKGLRDRARN